MQYQNGNETTHPPRDDRDELMAYTTSAGISFGTPDDALASDWRDARPTAACAAEETD